MSVAYIAQADAGSSLGVLWPLLLLGGLMYFLIIRPQRKRTRNQQALSAALEVGDQVRTIGGLMGVIVGLGDDWVTLGIEEGRIRVLRSAVAARMNTGDSS
ncbi:preprotein translocase subunit YajC [Candidatus Spongiisocius sp.]|uniref:preprotein translocase subunit YajC n=1 Tax=Candidatus Spongiisocius sp. TaxID=3101273 RepID=UPI003B5A4141